MQSMAREALSGDRRSGRGRADLCLAGAADAAPSGAGGGADGGIAPRPEERKGRTLRPRGGAGGVPALDRLTVEQLEKRADKKGEVWFATIENRAARRRNRG